MTESVTVTEHNVVTPVSTDDNGDVVKNSKNSPVTNTVTELNPITGTVEYADVLYNAAAELPAYAEITSTGVLVADLVRITGFTAGKKRCRVKMKYLYDEVSPSNDAGAAILIPFAVAFRAVINSPDTTDAAAKLTIIDNLAVSHTISPIDGAVPQTGDVDIPVEWDLIGTDYDVDDVYLVGIPPYTGTPVVPVLLTVEVW